MGHSQGRRKVWEKERDGRSYCEPQNEEPHFRLEPVLEIQEKQFPLPVFLLKAPHVGDGLFVFLCLLKSSCNNLKLFFWPQTIWPIAINLHAFENRLSHGAVTELLVPVAVRAGSLLQGESGKKQQHIPFLEICPVAPSRTARGNWVVTCSFPHLNLKKLSFSLWGGTSGNVIWGRPGLLKTASSPKGGHEIEGFYGKGVRSPLLGSELNFAMGFRVCWVM